MPELVFIENGEIYCEQCGVAILKKELGPKDYCVLDYDCFQPPSESDYPQHCGRGSKCINAETYKLKDKRKHRVGAFLENPLTSDGYEYVKSTHANNPSQLTSMWMDWYFGGYV